MARKKKDGIEQLENVPANGWPKVNQGSHLTVLTFEDGRTELRWDDEALMRDVQDAIRAQETTDFVGSLALGQKPKRVTKKKEK